MRKERKEFVEGFMAAVCLLAVRQEGKRFYGKSGPLEGQTRPAGTQVAGRVVLERYLDIPTYLRRGRTIRS